MEINCQYCFSKFDKKASEKQCSIRCRLLSKMNVLNDCWIWEGPWNPKSGYGLLRDGKKTKMAHRLSYEIFKGEIQKTKIVCHTCDNRMCINPDHLWTGTYSDNIQDALRKNRLNPPRGERNGRATLNNEKVMEIKKLLESKTCQNDIAKMFNIDQSTVSDIKRKKRWKHI